MDEARVISGEGSPARRGRRGVQIDTGWPFLLAGVMLLYAVVLIPALEDLEEAQWQRDRALAIERHRLERLAQHERYLEALIDEDPGLVQALAASQLNQIPAGRSIFLPAGGPGGAAASGLANASVFPNLEPGPVRLPPRVRAESRLASWCSDNGTRMWLIAGGAVMLFVGLIPQGRG